MKRIQFKLNNRIFAVEVENDNQSYDDIINDALEELVNQIRSNNETIQNIFFECLEVVCSECGVSLTQGEEPYSTKCLQCEEMEQ